MALSRIKLLLLALAVTRDWYRDLDFCSEVAVREGVAFSGGGGRVLATTVESLLPLLLSELPLALLVDGSLGR